ncbi:hypothetical protein M3Y99_00982200 [Aphelenchoides fujianensis]|nr:hypothetical protein M3Y99_00982200 [Aphelenchoides fujianensis]
MFALLRRDLLLACLAGAALMASLTYLVSDENSMVGGWKKIVEMPEVLPFVREDEKAEEAGKAKPVEMLAEEQDVKPEVEPTEKPANKEEKPVVVPQEKPEEQKDQKPTEKPAEQKPVPKEEPEPAEDDESSGDVNELSGEEKERPKPPPATGSADPKQKTLKRRSCSMRGFDEQTIRRLNSGPWPNVSRWTYGNDTETGVCAGANAENCVPAFVTTHMRPLYFSAKPIKTSVCMVHKSMSTVMRSLQCLLNNPLKFLYAEKNIADAGKEECGSSAPHAYQWIEEGGRPLNITEENGWKYVLVVRDPLDRFLSGYTHMCIYGMQSDCKHRCNGCGANLTCFLERQYAKFKQVAVDGRITERTVSHMAPQSWQCEVKKYLANYTILRYSSNSDEFFRRELRPFLRSRNVSKDALDYIRRHLTSTRTGHSTTGFSLRPWLEQQIRESPYLLRLFMQIFYFDYEVFGWPKPPIPSADAGTE